MELCLCYLERGYTKSSDTHTRATVWGNRSNFTRTVCFIC